MLLPKHLRVHSPVYIKTNKNTGLKKKGTVRGRRRHLSRIFFYPLPLQTRPLGSSKTKHTPEAHLTGWEPRFQILRWSLLPFKCGQMPNHSTNSVTSTNKLRLSIINFVNAIKKAHNLFLLWQLLLNRKFFSSHCVFSC